MKKYIALIFLLIAATVYFIFCYQDKALKFVPKNTDILILVDTKKCTRQYISGILMHPSLITERSKAGSNSVSLRDTGLKIPDFLQIFHIQGSPISHWYSVFEIKDEQTLLTYLKLQKFIRTGNNAFRKDFIFVKIAEARCLVGTSDSAFTSIPGLVGSVKNVYRADSFIDGSTGSLSFISGPGTRNFSIDLHDHALEIRNAFSEYPFEPVLNKLANKTDFLTAELNRENIDRIGKLFGTGFTGAAGIESLRATAQLREVKDTIITYAYDDQFNEIEKKTVQNIVLPNYAIGFKSTHPEKVIRYFREKKWMNDSNRFTAIPSEPNVVTKNKNAVEIIPLRNPIKLPALLKTNYVFLKNNPLLLSVWKTGSAAEKKLISQLEYFFCANSGHEYYVKLQFKKEKLPLILRL